MTRQVEVVVPEGHSSFVVENPTDRIDDLLDDALAYEAPNAEHVPAYQQGHWDGYKRLYEGDDHAAPVGLLDRATDVLEARGYTTTVTVENGTTDDSIDVEWRFDGDLRDYQRDAVDSVIHNRGGVVAIPTGGGKTLVGLKLVKRIGRRALVAVHTQELLYQWGERVRDVLGVDPRLIGDGNWSEGPVTVAVMQSLISRGANAIEGEYGTLLFDECHRTGAAEKMHEIGMDVDAGWRVGLSATPWRNVDGGELKIEGAAGPVVAEVSAEELIEAGHLARPKFRVIDPADYGEQRTADKDDEYHEAYRRCIELSSVRNQAVAAAAADLADDGYQVLVTVDRLNQGKLLEYALSGTEIDDPAARAVARNIDSLGGYAATFLSGQDPTDRRQDVVDAFGRGQIDILVSTLLKEGADIPRINAIVLSGGGQSDIEKIQRVGRALRPANGDHAVVADVRDRGRFFGNHFEERRKAFADYYGRFGPERHRDEGVGKVRAWLESHGFDLENFDVSRPASAVRIEKVGYIEDFHRFRDLMRDTRAVSFDGSHNYVKHPDKLPDSTEDDSL